jgi:hypothetical protein
MNGKSSMETIGPEPEKEVPDRRLFLRSLGKWSGAAIAAAVAGGAWMVASPPEANAGVWVNRRVGYGGGWINGRGAYVRPGYGGTWINRGGGAWINRRAYGGGGSWINRW